MAHALAFPRCDANYPRRLTPGASSCPFGVGAALQLVPDARQASCWGCLSCLGCASPVRRCSCVQKVQVLVLSAVCRGWCSGWVCVDHGVSLCGTSVHGRAVPGPTVSWDRRYKVDALQPNQYRVHLQQLHTYCLGRHAGSRKGFACTCDVRAKLSEIHKHNTKGLQQQQRVMLLEGELPILGRQAPNTQLGALTMPQQPCNDLSFVGTQLPCRSLEKKRRKIAEIGSEAHIIH